VEQLFRQSSFLSLSLSPSPIEYINIKKIVCIKKSSVSLEDFQVYALATVTTTTIIIYIYM
jgi:hypothetical protein